MQKSTSSADMLMRLRRDTQRPESMLPPAGTISLAVGDPDFNTPLPIIEAARRSLDEGLTHYADWNGDPELRTRIADAENAWSAMEYTSQNVVIGHGANGVLTAVVFAAVDPGDRVVVPQPTYSLYGDLVAMAGGVADYVPLSESLHLDLKGLERSLPGARMLILCNPGNPTGAVFPREELEAAADLAVGAGAVVVVDEAYADLVYDGVEFVNATSIERWKDNLVTCRTFSKTYAMTGWRIGYALAPDQLATDMRLVTSTTIGALNTVVQKAAISALDGGPTLADGMMEVYSERRRYMIDRIAEISGLTARDPEGAFYVFARYDADISSTELRKLLLARGVAVRPGREYGPNGEGHIRLSFATDLETIGKGLDIIEEVLAELSE